MTDLDTERLQNIRNSILEDINKPSLIKWHINDLDTLIYNIKNKKDGKYKKA